MNKALILTSVASMILQFNLDNIALLQELGYEVEVGCNFERGNTCSRQEIARLRGFLREHSVKCHQIPFARNVREIREHEKAYKKLKKLFQKEHYTLVHCQSPIGGVLGRFAGKRLTPLRVIYTAHGFHFYKGAPWKNWLLFYPVEWLCSWWTDVLITMNEEDNQLAKKQLHAKKTVYVPGIGIDTDSFYQAGTDPEIRSRTRQALGLEKEDILLLSVGELSKRKNHQVIVEAMALPEIQEIAGIRKLVDTKEYSSEITKSIPTGDSFKLRYAIAGLGDLENELKMQIQRLGIGDKVSLLGFRTDTKELLAAADIFVFPSLQEGLPVALMEAMAAGVCCVVSDIRGNRDLVNAIREKQALQETVNKRMIMVKGNRPEDWCQAVAEMAGRIGEERSNGMETEAKARQYSRVKGRFDREEVRKVMRRVYGRTL